MVSVLASLIVIVGGVYLLTKLGSVSVEFRTRLAQDETRLETGILDKVKESAEFDYKKSVLFINTKSNVAKIEKNNPYVKVQQVLRKFPNKVCIYISERIPKYRIQDSESSGKWYVLDDEFKVLECLTTAELESKSMQTKTVEVKYISEKTYVGDFLNNTAELQKLNEITAGVYGKTKDYFVVSAIDYHKTSDTFTLTMKSGDINYEAGCEIEIVGSNNLKNKAYKATIVYTGTDDSLKNIDLSKKVIIISDGNDCIIKKQEG